MHYPSIVAHCSQFSIVWVPSEHMSQFKAPHNISEQVFMVSFTQSPQLEDHLLSAVHQHLFNIRAMTLPYLEAISSICNLKMCHAVMQ